MTAADRRRSTAARREAARHRRRRPPQSSAARRIRRHLPPRRSRDRQRRGHAARQPARRARRRRAVRSKSGWPAGVRSRPTTCTRFTAVVFGAGDFHTPHRGSAAASAASRRAIGLTLGPLTATSSSSLGHPRLVDDRLRRLRRRDLGRARAPRPADSVRARRHAAGAVGRVDGDRRPAGGVRAAVRRIRARLAIARGAARPRCRLRDDHACRRHLVDRRRRARRASAVRRAVRDSVGDGGGDRRDPGERRARLSPSARRWCARSSTRPIRDGVVRPGPGIATQKVTADDAPEGRGRPALRRPRARHEPLRAAARVRGRRDAAVARRRWRRSATARTNSATRCWSAPGRGRRWARTSPPVFHRHGSASSGASLSI